ncbi:hypothetical protein EDC01DRAFT_781351 [Geopyxis carbonaria]|nr:hypothetical protein EDC01DRAFT_781351 [Geopyxis carbonaria]
MTFLAHGGAGLRLASAAYDFTKLSEIPAWARHAFISSVGASISADDLNRPAEYADLNEPRHAAGLLRAENQAHNANALTVADHFPYGGGPIVDDQLERDKLERVVTHVCNSGEGASDAGEARAAAMTSWSLPRAAPVRVSPCGITKLSDISSWTQKNPDLDGGFSNAGMRRQLLEAGGRRPST